MLRATQCTFGATTSRWRRRFLSVRRPCSGLRLGALVTRRRCWRLNEIYMKHTGQLLQKIEDVLERDYFMTAEMAKDFGLVDKVIDQRPEMLPLAAVS